MSPGAPEKNTGADQAPTGRWGNLQPWLVALLVVVLVGVITLLLLQSAGTIHLHFLGSNGSNGALSRR